MGGTYASGMDRDGKVRVHNQKSQAVTICRCQQYMYNYSKHNKRINTCLSSQCQDITPSPPLGENSVTGTEQEDGGCELSDVAPGLLLLW